MRTHLLILMVTLVGFGLCDTNNVYGQRSQPAREAFAERVQDMNLTDEQEAKIADIRKQYTAKVGPYAKALADVTQEEVAKVKAVLTAPQMAMLKNLKDERGERRAESLAERLAHFEELDLTTDEMSKIAAIRKEYRPKIVKALEGLKGTLTEEQLKDRTEGLESGKTHKAVIASLALTKEQKEKMATVGNEVRALNRGQLEKLRDILDPAPQATLTGSRSERKEQARDHMASAIENFQDLKLTSEQKTQIAEIRQGYRPKIQEASNKLRAIVKEELAAVMAVIKS